ncbi:MAG: hypothetical protein LBV53_01240 [Mycoplasmataceae bacterium]|jgi:hypothetical protein|nr:hypothetical protein [Mycoplasmataceae bacterium]
MNDEKINLKPSEEDQNEIAHLYEQLARISHSLFEFSSELLKYSLMMHHSVIGATTLTLQLQLEKNVAIIVATKKHDDSSKRTKIKYEEEYTTLDAQYKAEINEAEHDYQEKVKSIEEEYN